MGEDRRSPGVRSQEEHGSEWARFGVVADSYIRAISVAHGHQLVGSVRGRGRMVSLAKRFRAAVAHKPVMPLHRDRIPSASNVPAFQAWLNYLSVNPLSPNSSLAIFTHIQRERLGSCALVLRLLTVILYMGQHTGILVLFIF